METHTQRPVSLADHIDAIAVRCRQIAVPANLEHARRLVRRNYGAAWADDDYRMELIWDAITRSRPSYSFTEDEVTP